jgi:hypothetical protein
MGDDVTAATKQLAKAAALAAECVSEAKTAKPGPVTETLLSNLPPLLQLTTDELKTIDGASVVAAVEAFSASASGSLRRCLAAARAQLLLQRLSGSGGSGDNTAKAVALVVGGGLDRCHVTVDNCEEARRFLAVDVPLHGGGKAKFDEELAAWVALCRAKFPRSKAFGTPVRPVAGDDAAHGPADGD